MLVSLRGDKVNELSTEVKARETHDKAVNYFKVAEKYTYQFIMEIKKIRDNKYFERLGFDSFNDYAMSEWGVDQYYLSERIKIAETFNEEEFFGYNQKLGHRKTLLLARMDKPQREQALKKGIPTDSGYKPYSEATQQEINEYRRNAEKAEQRARQAEQQAEAERRERERLEEENERLANQEPKVIEKVVEDKTKINELTREINQLKIRIEQESNDAETYRKLRGDIERLSAKKDDMIRRIESAGTIGEFIARVERAFTEDLAPIKYTRAIRETSDSPAVVESVNSILETVEEWVAEIRREVPELKYYTEVIEHE